MTGRLQVKRALMAFLFDAAALEHFSLGWNQFNLGILQDPLSFNRIRDGYSGSN